MLTEINWSKGTNKTYDFRNEIRNNIISLDTANIEQANLLSHIYDFTKKNKTTESCTEKIES